MILRFLLAIGSVLAILFGLHFLLYSSIIRFLAIANPTVKTALSITLLFLSLSLVVSVPLVHWWENLLTSNFYVFAASWLGFLINLLLAVGLSWLVIGIVHLIGYKPHTQPIAIVFFVLAALYSIYGIWNAFHPRIRNLEVQIENLPTQWKNKTIVQLSDMHLGHVHRLGFLKSIIAKVNALNPELVLITGDLFDGMSGNLTSFVEPLNTLKAQRRIFYVTGNHETYIGVRRALDILEKTKINVLRNEVVELDGLQVVGISYPGVSGTENMRSLRKSWADFSTGKPRLLLFHTPTNIKRKDENGHDAHSSAYWAPDTSLAVNKEIGISLQLSGHTHKGQVFPFGYLTKLIYKGYDYGLHSEGSFSIYTTSGVGTWGPPMRTGNSPEIVVIKLK